MPRDHGRILVTIWNDPQFRALTGNAQRLYMLLISQKNMDHAGLIPLQINKWSRCSDHTTVEEIESGLRELALSHFAYFDEVTEEALVRTLIRNDGVLKQKNIFKNAMRCARAIESQYLRDAMALEIRKIDVPADREEFEKTVAELDTAGIEERFEAAHHALTEPFRNPSVTPPEDFPNPSERPADSYPSGTLREPLGNPSGSLGGGGGGESHLSTKSSFKEVSGFDSEPESATPEPDSTALVPAPPERDDVTRICEHLKQRIVDNGSRKPNITKAWRDAARLMIDRDGIGEAEIHRLIDWCQTDDFWRTNILSMPKFREQYDKLRLQSQRAPRSTFQRPSMGDDLSNLSRGREQALAAAAQASAQQSLDAYMQPELTQGAF